VIGGAIALVAMLLGGLHAREREDLSAVELRVNGFRSSDGRLRAALHDRDAGFPSKGGLQFATAEITDGEAKIVFTVPPGVYAISCFHDENGNGQLDTNWLGRPKEGICASNDAGGRRGPPKFRDAKLTVGEDGVRQTVKLVYF
jgi:uncharacterized protein (DUF2141 family)